MRLIRPAVSYIVCLALILPAYNCGRQVPLPETPLAPVVFEPLRDSVNKSYTDLFQEAPQLEFSSTQLRQMRGYFDQAERYCVHEFKQRGREYEREMNEKQRELRQRSSNLDSAVRRELHCRVQHLRVLKSQTEVLALQAIPVAYENKRAKLELIEHWPSELRGIQAEKASGEYRKRPHSDVLDIGFRSVGEGQEGDVRLGREAVEEMRRAGLLPPEVDDPVVRSYVTNLTQKIAAHSDLRVPVQISVLNSKEINAFALPGGYLFVQRGLLEAAEDESQLAGVIAHEIAHAAARHGHKLMRRATIASIIYQVAQVAAIMLVGPVGIGTYYALQYGFYGLGLVLNLNLLGVSRDFELEADQLGVQYAWSAGYDPTGFIRFFDKMATREGYVNGASWFRTHPPFYQRMVKAQREIMFLPERESLIQQSTAFMEMKKNLVEVAAQAEKDEKDRPSLLRPEEDDCSPPPKLEYVPGQRIETLCSIPPPGGGAVAQQ
ncbi:MAG: M48 family metalloprotease [Bryobacteraceae bacterium]